jgi:hypothetical protein
MPVLVDRMQAIGRIDAELCAEDDAYFSRWQLASLSRVTLVRLAIGETDRLTDRINLSTFWLFGAYEGVRALDQELRTRPRGFPRKILQRVNDLKHLYARPRVLLAKHEPAIKHKATDKAPAVAWMRNGGIAWRVAPRRIVARRALADGLLDVLEQIKASKRP